MKTSENEVAKLPMAEEGQGDQENCEAEEAIDDHFGNDIPQQSWQLAIAQDQTDSEGNPQPTLVAYPSSQKQAFQTIQPISLHPQVKQSFANRQGCPQAGDIWHTTPLPGGAQVISPMTPFLNYNNNASSGVPLVASGMECAHIQRPSVGLVQQVVECFKQSEKKEMLPSEVYVAMENVFPYYKHIVGQKRKSWMSSVRHALTTPRFKSRKVRQEDKERPKRGCLWSLDEDYDETALANIATRRRGRTPNPLKVTRRKQRFLGNTRTEYTPPLYRVNRNNTPFFQPQQHVSQRYPFLEVPDSAPMQTTFSPGPTGPIYAGGGGNMYYQPYRSPTVGYVIAGQKMAQCMSQQAVQPVNMGQWNVSGFSACNQQQYMPNNAAFYGGGSNPIMQSNSGMNQAFGHGMVPTILQTNQNNNAAADTQRQTPSGEPTPVSIQTAEHNQGLDDEDISMCDMIVASEDMEQQNQIEDFESNQSESQVHDEIKKELRSLVYESLDICNSGGQRSGQECDVNRESVQTVQQANTQSLQVNRSPTWAKNRPPHHAQGGFHNYAWSPLSHLSQNCQASVVLTTQTNEEDQNKVQDQDQDQAQDSGENTKIFQGQIVKEMNGQVVVQASISNESLDHACEDAAN